MKETEEPTFDHICLSHFTVQDRHIAEARRQLILWNYCREPNGTLKPNWRELLIDIEQAMKKTPTPEKRPAIHREGKVVPLTRVRNHR